MLGRKFCNSIVFFLKACKSLPLLNTRQTFFLAKGVVRIERIIFRQNVISENAFHKVHFENEKYLAMNGMNLISF